ncbi:MAG TPA: hypothetical protein VHC19_10195 [Pirellulales bacterium]|nr:hypothetical protein [Pirellulales bacterium]
MNPLRADQEHLLDLLVDGELDEANRRELLMWCQRDPEGWRQCALAFLEAQSWSRQLRDVGGAASLPTQTAPPSDNPQAAGSQTRSAQAVIPASRDPLVQRTGLMQSWKPFIGPLAMAASFLAAFGLGLLARSGWQAGRGTGRPESLSAANLEIARQEPDAAVEQEQGPGYAMPRRENLGQVRLVVDGPGGAEQEIQLPVVESGSMDADFLQNPPAAVPAEIQQMFERMGHQVRQRREMLPLRLKDGRRLIVPVDQVEVHPVGNRAYQ